MTGGDSRRFTSHWVPRLSRPLRYASALAATLLVILIEHALLPEPRFALFFLAVASISWLAGRLPGLLVVVLSAAWVTASTVPNLAPTVMYLLAATTVALLCGSLREAALSLQRVLSEQKCVEEALRRERDFSAGVLDTAGALVAVLDREGRVIRFNHACEATSGYLASEILGRHYRLLIPPEQLPRLDEGWAALLGGRFPSTFENHWLAKDGSLRLIEWSNNALVGLDGKVEHIIGIGVDITERRRAEEALRDADRHKTEFLGVLSHELRNPLAPIRHGLHILDRVPPGGEQAQHAKAVIDRQVGLLTRLVDDLLDVTRISRGKLQVQRSPLDLGKLLWRTVDDHRSLLARSRLSLEVRTAARPLWVNGDAARLAQAIGNLLSNAAKFGRSDGHVLVALEEDTASGMAVIRVRDDGVGIGADLLARLFVPFEQADRTLDRSRGGLGLGLALVKGLVAQHDGKVAAHSEGPGRGAEFTIMLPLESAPAPVVAASSPTPARTPRRVLVIEDNVDAANTLQQALALGKDEIQVAYDGSEGLRKAREFRPEVVFCDVGLPQMDGYEVAKAFRADEALRSTYLVALTGYALSEDRAKAKAAGFDQHLAKPPNLEQLSEILAAAPSRAL
jgi:two-component system CheB/CheR fusion protein